MPLESIFIIFEVFNAYNYETRLLLNNFEWLASWAVQIKCIQTTKANKVPLVFIYIEWNLL